MDLLELNFILECLPKFQLNSEGNVNNLGLNYLRVNFWTLWLAARQISLF